MPTLYQFEISVVSQLFCIRASDEGGRLVDRRPVVAAWTDRVDAATARPAAAASAGAAR